MTSYPENNVSIPPGHFRWKNPISFYCINCHLDFLLRKTYLPPSTIYSSSGLHYAYVYPSLIQAALTI